MSKTEWQIAPIPPSPWWGSGSPQRQETTMRLLIYTGKTVRIDGDVARYSRCEERDGKRIHILYFADTDEWRDFEEISGIHDDHYEAYNVEPVSDYYHDKARPEEKNRNYFDMKRRLRRY